MTAAPAPPAGRNVEILWPILNAVIVTMVLFYIDEGYYDFRWMKSPGNWLVFVFYVIILSPLSVSLSLILFRKHQRVLKILLDAAVGIPFTLTFSLLVFSYW